MDAMDDRYNYASPLTGHQDPVPNSDAARLRLDSPARPRSCEVSTQMLVHRGFSKECIDYD
jgi:hypothetical protein